MGGFIKMKLLVVTPYFFPKIGGMENYAYNIAKGLKEKYGWEVVVATSNHEERKYKEEQMDGMKIYRLPRWFKVSNTPINPLWYFQIKRIIKNERPDIINAHTPVPFITDITARVCGDIPFILTYHAASLYKYKNPIFNIFIFLYRILIERNSIKKARILIVVSEFVKIKLSSNLRKKIFVIHNSISEKDILLKIKRKAKNNIIIFLASLEKAHSWKGLDKIIEAIKWYIQNFNENIELLIVGDGNYKKHYEKVAEKLRVGQYVKFVGAKFGKDKYNFIRKAKILVAYPMTSNDAFPTVIIEAWANLIPIISSNIGPIPYIIDDRKNGYLVKPDSPKELAEGIHDLMQNDSLYDELIRNGLHKVRDFTWEKQIKKTNEIIKSVLNEK